MHFTKDRTAHTTAFHEPVVDHLLNRKIAQTANPPGMQAWSDYPNLYSRVLYRLTYILPHTPILGDQGFESIGLKHQSSQADD